MVRKTTILVAAIAAASIGGLAAGGAAGLVKTPGGAAAPAPALQLAVNGAGGAEDAARHGLRFGPGLQNADNPAEARRFRGGNGRDGQQMARRGGGARFGARGGRFGPGGGGDRDLDLTADQAGTLISAQLIMQGNDRLMIGSVTTQGEDTYVVDVVTLDNSLVMQIEVDRDTGRRSPIR